MKIKPNKIIQTLLICVVFNLGSYCQDKNSKLAKNSEEIKTTDLGNIFNSGEYNKFIELAEEELSRSKNKGLLIPLSIAYLYNIRQIMKRACFTRTRC
jgi:hypothetical protein